MSYMPIWFKVIDFSNWEFFERNFFMPKEPVKVYSKIFGELRTREAGWRWDPDTLIISGPERIMNFESLVLSGQNWKYVDPSECRRLADKLYATERRFQSWRLDFVTLADVFSLSSIMNGVAVY